MIVICIVLEKIRSVLQISFVDAESSPVEISSANITGAFATSISPDVTRFRCLDSIAVIMPG